MSHNSMYEAETNIKRRYEDDDHDDDLDALRKAALKTLYSNKRKKNYDASPVHENCRSTSRSSSSTLSSRSNSTHSFISRSSSLSSISSDSLDRHDIDYRFETTLQNHGNGDIDERFPPDFRHDEDSDALIVHCPIQDDDLLTRDDKKTMTDNIQLNEKSSRKRSRSKEATSNNKKHEPRKSSAVERPVSITVQLNSSDFDLRQLIKSRRNQNSSKTNQRIVQILHKDENSNVQKADDNYFSSKHSDTSTRLVEKYRNNKNE